MNFKKIIILTGETDRDNQKGILNIEAKDTSLFCNFKGINFLPKDRILGVYINQKLYKFDLNSKNLEFKIENIDYIDNVSVVVLDRQNMLKPFLWGSQILTENDSLCNKIIEEINIKTKDEMIPKNVEKEENEPKNIETNNFSFVENLKDKTEFFENKNIETVSNSTTFESEDDLEKVIDTFQDEIDEINKDIDLEFYNMISSQVESMLKNNEKEKILEEIIPESKFVSVPKSNGESYVFGIIYENNKPKYLCYGERGKFSEERPEHLKAYYQWLPIDVDNVSGDGYFMMYQDAKTGENLEMTVI